MSRMTHKEAAKLIGRAGHYAHGNLIFRVEVTDVREVFGRTDVQIKPVAGSGMGWISLDKITLRS